MAAINQKESFAETAQRLVSLLETADSEAKRALRKNERTAYARTVDLIMIGQVGHPMVPGYTRNLSSGGIGLLTRRMFKVDERFVTLLSLGGGLGKYALCRVTFCRYVSDCMYELGAQFEATAPRFSSKHQIPENWITISRTEAAIKQSSPS